MSNMRNFVRKIPDRTFDRRYFTSMEIKGFYDSPNMDKVVQALGSEKLAEDFIMNKVEAYKTFENIFTNVTGRNYADTSLADLNGISPQQIIDVTVYSLIKSVAPYVAVERNVQSPEVVLPFYNLVKVADDSIQHTNIGPSLTPNQPKRTMTIDEPTTTNAGDEFSISIGERILPGSVTGSITDASRTGGPFSFRDDGDGQLLIQGPFSGRVDYSGATVFITNPEAWVQATDSIVVNIVNDNSTGTVGNLYRGDIENFTVTTAPKIYQTRHNLIADAVATASLGVNAETVTQLLINEYVKSINDEVVDTLVNGYTSAPANATNTDINLSAYVLNSASNTDSLYKVFSLQIENEIARLENKSYRSVYPSSILAGERLSTLFRGMADVSNTFVPADNESTFIEGLIGYYKKIPVIKTHRLPKNDGFIISKTQDGKMAPVCRATFIPLNNIPEVANYTNALQYARGAWAYEGSSFLTPRLAQRFNVAVSDTILTDLPTLRPEDI